MYIPFRAWKGAKDEAGNVYGKLTVLGIMSKDRYGSNWECLCECGNKTLVKGIHLRYKKGTRSCGCIKGTEVKHGQRMKRGKTTYHSWKSMKARCDEPNHPAADYYYDRGITYDPAWSDFETFYADMGERPVGTTLDRENNDLGYSKDNCRWATPKVQANNRRPARTVRGRKP